MEEKIKDVTNTQEKKLEINVVPSGQYLKKKEFESHKNPYEMSKLNHGDDKPKTDVELGVSVNPQDAEKGIYEVVLSIKTKTEIGKHDLFNLTLDYAGLFTISQASGELDSNMRDEILMVHCPTMLFPYVRREVSIESVEAGFLPLVINNVDFATLYRKQKGQE